MQYFYSYNLGYRGEAGVTTEIGSAVHGVVEALALIKKNIQEDGPNFIEHSEFGKIEYDPKTFTKPYNLSDEEVDEINKSRSAVSTYKDKPFIGYGTTRHGVELVNHLMDRAIPIWLAKFDPKPAEIRNFKNYTWMLLEKVDPRFENIVSVEFHFDVEIPYEWALKEDGSRIRFKGFIDLVCEPEPGVWVIYDWKTGQRKDWNTGEVKTYAKIKQDLQLAMYYYVLSEFFTDNQIIANLFYVRDGGIFTVTFDKNSKELVEYTVKKHIEDVRSCTNPKLLSNNQSDQKCRYFCQAFKNSRFSSEMCDCAFLKNAIAKSSLEEVEKVYRRDTFEC